MLTKSTSMHCLVMVQSYEFADYQLNYVHIDYMNQLPKRPNGLNIKAMAFVRSNRVAGKEERYLILDMIVKSFKIILRSFNGNSIIVY